MNQALASTVDGRSGLSHNASEQPDCGVTYGFVRWLSHSCFSLALQKDYQLLELELARSRVSANRVAVATASEWKEDSDKVIPVKQWVEERKYLQGEMKQMQVSIEGQVA